MKIKRAILAIVLMNCCLLLTSTAAMALAVSSGPADHDDSVRIQQVFSERDEAVIKKFQSAKEWIQKQKPLLGQYFSDGIAKFKKEISRVSKDIIAKYKKLKDRVTSKYYTQM